MTEMKKHYQGQKGYNPKELCPECGEILSVQYIRKLVNGKRFYKKVGVCCPNDDCEFCEKRKEQ